jgi:hypothetical protein
MSIGTPNIRLQDLGLPVIKTDSLLVSGGKGPSQVVDVTRLIAQSLVTTLIFLIIIIWFTLALNASTREQIDSDYFLFQFAVYFSIIAIFLIIFIILLVI